MQNRRRKSHLNLALFVAPLALALALPLATTSCGGHPRPLLEDLNQHEDVSLMRLGSANGIRDGDRLSAQLLITDSSSILTMDLHFLVTPPTHLETGTWKSNRGAGKVEARSVTFLGGQSEPPSLGGTFDLLDGQGQARFRVHLPTTLLQK